MASGSGDDRTIRDQIEFYREQARLAPLYLGSSGAAPEDYERGTADLVRAYCPQSVRCLELASGAGRWTEPLLGVCQHITAVDSSPEMHAFNRARNGDARVEYVEADLFAFQPDDRYDLIFGGFWLSHVPQSRFTAFWAMLERALAPDGRVVMVDDGIRDADGVVRFAADATGTDANRRLPDGRHFTIVKNAYAPSELETRLADLGWTAQVSLLTPVVYVVVAHT